MKKMILSLMSAMLGCTAFAANCVSAQQLSTDYAARTVTFKLTWTGCNAADNHLNKVWCFIDCREIDAGGGKGVWKRAVFSGTPAVVNGTYVAGNTAGFYVTGTNGQSATVTAKLDNMPEKFDWCAFATDYPPNIGTVSNGIYTLRGTQSFEVNGGSITGNQHTGAINSLTDATGCPDGCIAAQDFKFSNSNVTIPCCPNLTAVNGYCRDLAADNAAKMICNSVEYEVKLSNETGAYAYNTAPSNGCPTGWKWPNYTIAKCIYTNRTTVWRGAERFYVYPNVADVNCCANDCSTSNPAFITAGNIPMGSYCNNSITCYASQVCRLYDSNSVKYNYVRCVR